MAVDLRRFVLHVRHCAMECECFGAKRNNVLRDSLSHAVRGSVRDCAAVCTWTTVTAGWDKHADKMRMRKNVCGVGVLFTCPT